MFIVHTVHDTILIQPSNLGQSTVQAIFYEIDQRYPNRILMDVGLVIARYGDTLEHVSHGVCVAGQGGAHHFCSFQLIVFRPFVEEVCLGRIHRSTNEGIYVTLGFFGDIFIPAYWMLRPSVFEESTGLWVWTPEYGEDDDDEEEEEGDNNEDGGNDKGTNKSTTELKKGPTATNEGDEEEGAKPKEEENRYEMEIGSEIRFKVKSIHFARITNSAKGRQAFVSTTDKPTSSAAAAGATSNNKPGGGGASSSAIMADTVASKSNKPPDVPSSEQLQVRRRSSSVGLDDDTAFPPAMHIVASICEDGLGLTSWWSSGGAEEEEEGDDGEDAGGEEAVEDE
ncbi:hypothetical protein ACA910_000902 [Epithemia clementina (nom. ined.)]